LFARQLASQRTAFAITEPGPMQSDLFPVLEYAAPYAFYLGESSRMLEKFDERTRQQLLAPAAKQALLKSLPGDALKSVFSKYSTVNNELLPIVRGAAPGNVPCILNPNASRISILPVLGTNAEALSQSANLLGGTPEQTFQGITGIETVLAAQPSGTNSVAADWSSLAAAAALSLNDYARAAQLCSRALKFNPDDEQAAFLLHLLAREKPELFQK
jgi:tetratricopeptide (TPR) repeat protein